MFAVWSACNGADGISDIEGKVTRVGASECGQRASFNRDRDLADEPHWCSSVFGCRNACSLADSLEISYHDVVTAEKALGAKFNIRAFYDAVLELSSVPLPVVTARIDRFIAEGGKGPYPDMESAGRRNWGAQATGLLRLAGSPNARLRNQNAPIVSGL
jgi:hypothetical protein